MISDGTRCTRSPHSEEWGYAARMCPHCSAGMNDPLPAKKCNSRTGECPLGATSYCRVTFVRKGYGNMDLKWEEDNG